jgi:hypothetical protein
VNLGELISFQPTVAGGRIYLATNQGNLFCLNTGDPRGGWFMRAPAPRTTVYERRKPLVSFRMQTSVGTATQIAATPESGEQVAKSVFASLFPSRRAVPCRSRGRPRRFVPWVSYSVSLCFEYGLTASMEMSFCNERSRKGPETVNCP